MNPISLIVVNNQTSKMLTALVQANASGTDRYVTIYPQDLMKEFGKGVGIYLDTSDISYKSKKVDEEGVTKYIYRNTTGFCIGFNYYVGEHQDYISEVLPYKDVELTDGGTGEFVRIDKVSIKTDHEDISGVRYITLKTN